MNTQVITGINSFLEPLCEFPSVSQRFAQKMSRYILEFILKENKTLSDSLNYFYRNPGFSTLAMDVEFSIYRYPYNNGNSPF